jgi:hypothetical protein
VSRKSLTSIGGGMNCLTVTLSVALDVGLRLTKLAVYAIFLLAGQDLPELTPVEIVGYEVCEAGSSLALDNE